MSGEWIILFKPEKPTKDAVVIEKSILSRTEKARIKRVVPSAVFTLHGLVHLLGFVVYWRLAQVEGIFYRTEPPLGNLQVRGPGIGEAVPFAILVKIDQANSASCSRRTVSFPIRSSSQAKRGAFSNPRR